MAEAFQALPGKEYGVLQLRTVSGLPVDSDDKSKVLKMEEQYSTDVWDGGVDSPATSQAADTFMLVLQLTPTTYQYGANYCRAVCCLLAAML